MAKRRRRRRQKLPQEPVEAIIESLSQDGKGVTHIDNKAVFISGALPSEKVTFIYTSKRRSHDEGIVHEVLEASDERVEPKCPYFSICGGCNLQHLASDAQIKHKQKAMLDALKHIGHVEPVEVFEPMTGEQWGYRRKARLGVRHVRKKGRVLVGFREKQGGFLAEIDSCEVLHDSVGKNLPAFQDLIYGMDAREQLPQIEVAVGDNATALIVRHLEPLSESDFDKWMAFAKEHDYQLYLQPKGPDTVHLIYPESAELFYEHPDFNTKVMFGPQDFFQVNTSINLQMVPRAVELLQLTGNETVLDLFCGLGNFTLPIARHAAHVTGVEGDDIMVMRARQTAQANQIENTDYYSCDLMGDMKGEPWLKKQYDCILLDPPRSGAKEVIEHFGKLKAKRIVYVSCHPATLARDADVLVNTQGYKLLGAGIMDMFPHTAHVESIAVFEL
ncbi:MAG TPA: 23S rRNA (uracil(1939)-C(5))-methyltransferase RlmD [Leucothrix mucor]|uniref:23S rRNA (uracil(1939)-C(5))-methyltransferase RlmD n=1 Tax=Leucothrix mucor TaxID=45248 RepID=A0A7V2T0C1_LEUMU|nr:23S rRNA (uracil(1939)-C(5))-methyltransferase RlmD [Leucothrix mucor]